MIFFIQSSQKSIAKDEQPKKKWSNDTSSFRKSKIKINIWQVAHPYSYRIASRLKKCLIGPSVGRNSHSHILLVVAFSFFGQFSNSYQNLKCKYFQIQYSISRCLSYSQICQTLYIHDSICVIKFIILFNFLILQNNILNVTRGAIQLVSLEEREIERTSFLNFVSFFTSILNNIFTMIG